MKEWDVAVIGAGPAGAVCAALLARRGLKVLVVEKQRFPRFRIGESLLPIVLPVFKEMGFEPNPSYSLRKGGALVTSENPDQSYRISFEHVLPDCPTYAYQVLRSQFDLALIDRARDMGAHVQFEHRVSSIREDEHGVTLEGPHGPVRARYLVDAGGQSAPSIGRQRKWVRGMGRFATFRHYRGVRSEKARTMFASGDILLLLIPGGSWAWAIPLPDDHLSLGVVAKDGDKAMAPQKVFGNLLASSSLMKDLLRGAEPVSQIYRCSDFSYYNRQPHGPRTVALGDAHAFLDPVFSAGVSLAITASHLLDPHLAKAVSHDKPLELDDYHAYLDRGYQVYERLIERFYRPGWAHTTFFSDEKPDAYVRELNTMLAGDVWREDNLWQNRLLASRRRTISYQDGTHPRA